ncbi:hypothetical protein Pcinc_041106 [Petrolisthes cinctipes]|uniref:Secreted protein n=1 Tax=Petrolisthes cinctipes TaxID=88211 RepID=A0AAE1BNA8_PETCI|nr:hypothetical protein Pcinc_041106 [Petrolisthes cinctipes]
MKVLLVAVMSCDALTWKLEGSVTCVADAGTLKGVEFNRALLDEWEGSVGCGSAVQDRLLSTFQPWSDQAHRSPRVVCLGTISVQT